MSRRDPSDRDDGFEAARERLVDSLVDAGRIERKATIDALRAVPRHEFVPEPRREDAYADRPLPIGSGQTISAPHMVGIMCDVLAPSRGDRILEIGTGCGYHAAVTAEIVGAENVYSVEYVESLADDARRRLDRLGYGEIDVRVGDGREGWPERAPSTARISLAPRRNSRKPLSRNSASAGGIVAPIGTSNQTLVEAVRTADGLERRTHGGVRFVTIRGEG